MGFFFTKTYENQIGVRWGSLFPQVCVNIGAEGEKRCLKVERGYVKSQTYEYVDAEVLQYCVWTRSLLSSIILSRPARPLLILDLSLGSFCANSPKFQKPPQVTSSDFAGKNLKCRSIWLYPPCKRLAFNSS